MSEASAADRCNRIIRDTHLWLRAAIRGFGVRSTDADDIAQETYLAFYHAQDRIPDGGQTMAWLRATAYHQALMHFRRQRTSKRKLHELIASSLAESERLEPPDEPAIVDALRACLNRLPAVMRSLIDLRYTQDADPERIGQLVNQSAATVRKNLHRARELLRTCLGAPRPPAGATT